jgi:hypothetical protein
MKDEEQIALSEKNMERIEVLEQKLKIAARKGTLPIT